MLPKADDRPLGGTETPKVPLISTAICAQLQSPKLRQLMFPRRQSPPVPKITVDEDGDLPSRKDNVGRPIQPLTIFPKTNANPPEFTLNQLL